MSAAQITLHATDGLLYAVPYHTIAANSTLDIYVSFSDSWGSLEKTAVFENENGDVSEVIIEQNHVRVPDEFVVAPHFWITIFEGDKFTTNRLEIIIEPTLKGVS